MFDPDVLVEAFATPGKLVGHFAYVLLIASMLMRQMRKLRMLAIASGAVSAIYGYYFLGDLVTAFWEAMFTLVNIGQLAILEISNRKTRYSEEEAQFVAKAVPALERGEARKLLKLANHEKRDEGAVLTMQAKPTDDLYFILSGAARVEINGAMVGVCGADDFLGEIGFMGDGRATATATVTHEMRVLRFEAAALSELLRKNGAIRQAVEATFNRNLMRKLISVNEGLAPAAADTL